MSSPWMPVVRNAINFEDVLSEELARSLNEKEEAKCNLISAIDTVCGNKDDENVEFICESEQNDAIIAQLLQAQYDDEYDDGLKRYESKINQGSKVSVSLNKYLRKNVVDKEGENRSEKNNTKNYNQLELAQKIMSQIPKKRGYMKINGQLITKHDDLLTSRINTSKLMDFALEFKTGDGAKNDMKLTNKVYNMLKECSLGEQHRRARCKDKKDDDSFQEMNFNKETKFELSKLLKNKNLVSINNVIGYGKESTVLYANLNSNYFINTNQNNDCVLKVFKTSLADYKPRGKYIKDDIRFKNRCCKQSRKYIIQWAEKEQLNLDRLQKIGIRCPEVIMRRKNILIETFIGENGNAAPRLKDVQFESYDELQKAYDETIDIMKRFFKDAQLVHGDLSEFNILWFKGNCWFIDVSQAVEPTHPNAFNFLMRDCVNVINYFNRQGLEEILTADELFYEISGEQYSENKPNVYPKVKFDNENYNRDMFDRDWEKSKMSSSFDSANN